MRDKPDYVTRVGMSRWTFIADKRIDEMPKTGWIDVCLCIGNTEEDKETGVTRQWYVRDKPMLLNMAMVETLTDIPAERSYTVIASSEGPVIHRRWRFWR